MNKVKNSPGNYVKRSQIRSASVRKDYVADAPSKRTSEDFSKIIIDQNFYMIFNATSKHENDRN